MPDEISDLCRAGKWAEAIESLGEIPKNLSQLRHRWLNAPLWLEVSL